GACSCPARAGQDRQESSATAATRRISTCMGSAPGETGGFDRRRSGGASLPAPVGTPLEGPRAAAGALPYAAVGLLDQPGRPALAHQFEGVVQAPGRGARLVAQACAVDPD